MSTISHVDLIYYYFLNPFISLDHLEEFLLPIPFHCEDIRWTMGPSVSVLYFQQWLSTDS